MKLFKLINNNYKYLNDNNIIKNNNKIFNNLYFFSTNNNNKYKELHLENNRKILEAENKLKLKQNKIENELNHLNLSNNNNNSNKLSNNSNNEKNKLIEEKGIFSSLFSKEQRIYRKQTATEIIKQGNYPEIQEYLLEKKRPKVNLLLFIVILHYNI